MKLSQSQIQDIERYLDYHELKQVDLRVEVLDHMAESIEAAMENGVSYVDAFNRQRERWNPELESYSSFWLGWALSGPKMMIKKCAQMMRKIYLFALLSTVLISGILFFILKLLPLNVLGNTLDIIIKILFVIPFLVSLLLLYKIKQTSLKTTYQYFYKTQAWGWSLCGTLFNPILISNKPYFGIEIRYVKLLWPVFLIMVCLQFYKIYQKHIRVIKRMA
ncbi:hypothetical protein [uncultured Maribacter sp.]|uniref:hypothetical protein n=1 Tax=uncultured Maribacter sp. TaxID=431308 RepID=UPI0026375E89|nr:hypothetical protein [uncultured Maribacter sp.]